MSTHKTRRNMKGSTGKIATASADTKKMRQRKDRTIGTSLKDKKKYTFSGYRQVPTQLILIIAAIVAVVVILVFYMPSCSSLSSSKVENPATKISVKDKIEPGTPASLADKLTPVLERNEKMSWIAANTSKYSDARIVELAIREPDAIDFVYNYPTNPPAAGPYTKGVQKGTAPVLYCWNNNWGAVNYGGLPLAVTGSGPCVLSMAYMGTFGKTDKTPADMAELAKNGGYVTEKGITVADFFTNSADKVGLSCKVADKSEQTVSLALSKRHFLIAHMQESKRQQDPGHWILIADHSHTGALVVHDPTSTENTMQLWDAGNLLSKVDELFVVADANEKEA